MATINDLQYDSVHGTWTVQATAIGNQAVATKAATANACHYIKSIHATFNGIASGVQLRLVSNLGGASETTHGTYFVHDQSEPIIFEGGLRMPTRNESVSAVLESGGALITGAVVIYGFTSPENIT